MHVPWTIRSQHRKIDDRVVIDVSEKHFSAAMTREVAPGDDRDMSLAATRIARRCLIDDDDACDPACVSCIGGTFGVSDGNAVVVDGKAQTVGTIKGRVGG